MLENISVINFLIYATCFGFAVAIIYTNIQRTALSKFISYLISNNISELSNAKTTSEMGLGRFEITIIRSAVKNQHGLKRCIKTVKAKTPADKLEAALEGSEQDKYYLGECDREELLKKYSFKPLSTKLLIGFIIALTIVVITVTAAIDWLITKVSLPDLEEKEDTEITDTIDSNIGSDSINNKDSEINESNDHNVSEDYSDNKTDSDNSDTIDEDQDSGPTIPTMK